jgi:hypothetical protein
MHVAKLRSELHKDVGRFCWVSVIKRKLVHFSVYQVNILNAGLNNTELTGSYFNKNNPVVRCVEGSFTLN